MTVPRLTATDFGGPADAPLLVLGPSLGTSVTALWGDVARELTSELHVIGWDLPGHGHSDAGAPYDISELATAVLQIIDHLAVTETAYYAGDSIGGAVGLQLMLDAPARIASAILICTSAKIGEPAQWRTRAEAVRKDGTETLVGTALQRWFGKGFSDRQPATADRLLDSLRAADREGYANACAALAQWDVQHQIANISAPVLAVAGSDDVATPPDSLRQIADGVVDGRLMILDGVGHLAPAESPTAVARLIHSHVRTSASIRHSGLAVRRQVLGDTHVDRAIANTTPFTAEFQAFITEYAWGRIWTRPGLDRRSRSMITLTALVARGHHEELAMHVRAARRNGLTPDEIKEVLLQSAVYCGVPEANTAFRIANEILANDNL